MSAVLLVDDSPADRALFRTILTRAGFTVQELARGREVVARARDLRPHVIVLDVNLPDTDGHSVCRQLRADPLCQGIPVLMLTVRGNEADELAGLEAGADDFVPKDAVSEIVLARVRRLVRYRQMATASLLNEQLAQIGRLLAGIVHEIRGPLSVIRGNAELLRLHVRPDDEELGQWIDPIVRGTQLLQARLEHLMAAVRTGPPVLQPLELGPVIREATELFLKGTDPRSGKVEVKTRIAEHLPPVLGDGGRLIQVLLNLLANAHDALLAHQAEGHVEITARERLEGPRRWVTIDVADDGPGIPPDVLSRIFEPFFTTKPSGSGYGLYLASEIVREHGGKLTVCNRDPSGACFTIWLPPAPPPGAQAEAAREAKPATSASPPGAGAGAGAGPAGTQ